MSPRWSKTAKVSPCLRTSVRSSRTSAVAAMWYGLASIGAGHAKVFLTVGVGALLVAAVRASRQAVIPLWAEGVGLVQGSEIGRLTFSHSIGAH